MAVQSKQTGDMTEKVLHEKTVFDGFFKITEGRIRRENYGGGTEEITRLSFDRGDSAAVLIYETDTDKLIFTEQYRYPSGKKDCARPLEIPAGAVDPGEDPCAAALREAEEETGYRPASAKAVAEFFPSPGGSSERVFVYYAPCTSADRSGKGGGSKAESEDIRTVKYSAAEVREMYASGSFRDAKTLIAVQWFLMGN